jgi:hypothetical protein
VPVYKPGEHDGVRASARRFEEALPAEKRKRLGQFFTGIPLGKLLAHLALRGDTHSVLDPMAGHGDLLDAVNEAALERGLSLRRLDGLEIDEDTARFCDDRLNKIMPNAPGVRHTLICGSAFDNASLKKLPERAYDLTITNPPYVRYQTQSAKAVNGDSIRSGLKHVIGNWVEHADQTVWQTIAQGYSGLADLSVPAWILSALTVRPEGRLALVVPATWRSREYGDIVRYLLLRLFRLEYIVEDTQPGWFSDALIRTHLIVARRLPSHEIAQPLIHKSAWASAQWIQIAPQAADSRSLVGGAFAEKFPEAALAQWLETGAPDARQGINIREFSLHDEWTSLKARAARRTWYQKLEPDGAGLSLFANAKPTNAPLPEPVRDIFGDDPPLVTLQELGIRAGQGLRTGCNRFFYVDELGPAGDDMVRIKASSTFNHDEFVAPANALRPVLRRQSELEFVESGKLPPGRALDLRQWVLAEDALDVAQSGATYRDLGESIPSLMPEELAVFVRRAAKVSLDDEDRKRVPELSAVRTNVRAHRRDATTPRFWYMLPDFMPRHQPAAFVGRINHGAPWVECNLSDPILIDANFSTFWPVEQSWTCFGIKALMNSAWCQLLMESFGTPMGGGALKLEAVHLRQLPLPHFDRAQREALDAAGRAFVRNSVDALAQANSAVLGALCKHNPRELNGKLALIVERTNYLRRMRLRTAA